MNPDVKKRWLAALQSGEYEQGVGRLNSNGKFCCLGVLCELAAKEGVVPVDADSFVVWYDGKSTFPPDKVAAWAGLDSINPQVRRWGRKTHLSRLNDVEGLPFRKIARLIRRSL